MSQGFLNGVSRLFQESYKVVKGCFMRALKIFGLCFKDTGTTNRLDLRLNQTDIQFSNGNLSFNSQIGAVSILR